MQKWCLASWRSISRNGHCTCCNQCLILRVQEEVWEVLNILEYSSARARMSVIARGPDGGIHVFTKGADARVGARFLVLHASLGWL